MCVAINSRITGNNPVGNVVADMLNHALVSSLCVGIINDFLNVCIREVNCSHSLDMLNYVSDMLVYIFALIETQELAHLPTLILIHVFCIVEFLRLFKRISIIKRCFEVGLHTCWIFHVGFVRTYPRTPVFLNRCRIVQRSSFLILCHIRVA